MTFTAAPKIVNGERPSGAALQSLAQVLSDRGCKIIMVCTFGVSAESSNEVFQQLQTEKGQGDLALLDTLIVAPPPVYFA